MQTYTGSMKKSSGPLSKIYVKLIPLANSSKIVISSQKNLPLTVQPLNPKKPVKKPSIKKPTRKQGAGDEEKEKSRVG